MASELLIDKTIPKLDEEAEFHIAPFDSDNQSVVVKDKENGVRRRRGYEDKLLQRPYRNVNTCYDNFRRAAKQFSDKNCLGYRKQTANGESGEYEWFTYKQVEERVHCVGKALHHLGLETQDKVAVYSKNRPEWQFMAQGCAAYSFVNVALYPSLGPDSSKYIINHAEVKCVAVSGECLEQTLDLLEFCSSVQCVVSFDDISQEIRDKTQEKNPNVKLFHFDEFIKLGEEHGDSYEQREPKAEDLAVLMYTSGTTGAPKGVMLTHANIVSARTGVHTYLYQIQSDDIYLSFLPLAHILGRVAEEFLIGEGVPIGYWQGDIRKIIDDIQTLRPTVMAVVPRVLEKIFQRLEQRIQSYNPLVRYVVNSAIDGKRQALQQERRGRAWDWIAVNRMRKLLGGRMRGMISGGAPLRPEIQDRLRSAFDIAILQGYGLTETCAMAVIQNTQTLETGNPGSIVPCVEIKLKDVEEMGYKTSNDPPQGEVCIRGPSVTQGYYKDEEKTKEAFDDDGWFLTGDIGQWNVNGTLQIIDRKKNIFKLAQGEYVPAELLEELYKESKYVEQLFVYGDSYKTCLVAVGVVDKNAIQELAKTLGISPDTEIKDVCQNQSVRDAVKNDVNRIAKEQKRNGFEKLKDIYLETVPFDEQDLMTPSMKLIRNKLRDHYKKEINDMYEEKQEEQNTNNSQNTKQFESAK